MVPAEATHRPLLVPLSINYQRQMGQLSFLFDLIFLSELSNELDFSLFDLFLFYKY